MQTRPKLLHYGLSWPISGAFANPNCALAGRDCSIQTVCRERKRERERERERENASPAMWAAIIYKIFIICAEKPSYFYIQKKLTFMLDILFAYHINARYDQFGVPQARFYSTRGLNSLGCRARLTLRRAEWQLYLRPQTAACTEMLLSWRVARKHVWKFLL